MKKLHALLTMLLAFITMSAGNVMINVDNAANVTVQTQAGYGRTLELTDGMNRFTDLSSADSPLTIKANDGAEIVSVVTNQTTTQNPSGDGAYRLGIDDNGMMIEITTSGNGQSGTTPLRDVSLWFTASGTDVSGSPFTVSYEKDGTWTPVSTDSFGMYTIPENSKVKVTPISPYLLQGLTLMTGAAVDTTPDGNSLTFTCTYDLFYYMSVYVNLSLDPTAIRFSVSVDNSANVYAYLTSNRSSYSMLQLRDGNNTFACLPEQLPLEFMAANGASILEVKKNGTTMQQPLSGWVLNVENNDAFALTTLGKEVSVEMVTADTDAPLEAYIYKDANGNEYFPTGHSYTLRAHLGDVIYVTPRPGTEMSYINTSNPSGQTDMLTYFKVAEGGDYINPMKVQIFGTVASTVTINVDAAERVKVLQEGGRGTALSLTDGENVFSISDIKNALAISATEGNQIVSVTLNDQPQSANANGLYIINAKEGNIINVTSRRNPVDINVSLLLPEGADLSWLKASVEGTEVEVTSPMTIRTYEALTLTAAPGYSLNSLVASVKDGVTIESSATGTFTVTVTDASITNLGLSLMLFEQTPAQGNAIVVPHGDELFISFWEMSETPIEGKSPYHGYYFVKTLTNNTANEVEIGHVIRVYNKNSQSQFQYIKVNGNPIEIAEGSREEFIKIEGRTEIETEIWSPTTIYTGPSYDEEKTVQSGNVYFEVNGEKITSMTVTEGTQIKLVAEPSKGYKFVCFKRYYPAQSSFNGTEVPAEYTITAADCENESVMFQGEFTIDEDARSYKVCGTTAWVCDSEGNVQGTATEAAKGTVGIVWPGDGRAHPEYLGYEGEVLELQVVTSDEEFANNYAVNWYCLMENFPHNKIEGYHYTINPDDANENGEIWISAVLKSKSGALESVAADGTFCFDSLTATLQATGEIKVFDINGRKVAQGNGTLSVASLEAGLYIAVSGTETLKFAK